MRHINKIWLIVSCLFIGSYCIAQTIPPSRVSQQVTALQYYFNTPDPGVGQAGNGAIIQITPTNNLTQQLTIPVSNLPLGINNLYVRVMDDSGSWSIAERRMFLVDNFTTGSNIVAAEYYFDSDVNGVGSGTPISISGTDVTQTLSIPLPNLSLGIHNLYIRTKNATGVWTIAERRLFLIDNFSLSNIVAGEYFIDTDVNGVGGGTPIVISGNDVTQTFAISLPTLSNGIHDLYIRTQSANGVWSIAERRVFLIDNALSSPIVAMEYFFDNDNGVGTGTSIPVSTSSDINGTFAIVIPCGMVAGNHQLFVRAQNENGIWSIFERGSFTTLSGIATPVVSASGPTSFCTGGSVVLSTTPAGAGISYQWFKDNVAITGQTSNSFTATESGSYTIQASCGSDISTSTAITVVSSVGGSFVPSIDASNTLVCAGTTVTLTANANPFDPSMTYLWNTNETTQAITVTTGGIYSVTITNGSCVLSSSITLTSGLISSLSAIANPTALCAGNDLNLTAEPTLNISGMDISNYSVRSIPYAPQNLNGATNLIANGAKNNSFNYISFINFDDGMFMGITLPFAFNFYGIEYNSINISTNGFVQFGQNHNEQAFHAPDIHSPGSVLNFIGGAFMDFDFDNNGILNFGTSGTTPNRKFYINWNGPVLGATTICQSQIVLNETSGIIETLIDNFISGGERYTIGIEDITGTLGIAAPSRNQTSNQISSPEGWQFSPVIPSNLATYSWFGPNSYISTEANPVITNAQDNNSGSYTVTITDNLGCSISATTDNVLITSGQIQTLNCTSDVVVSNDHGLCGATVNYTPTNTGQQASIITYSGNHAPGSSFNIGTTTVTATATNGCTSATCSFNITVNDNEPPVINCPAAITQCDPVVTFDATATDNCGGNIAVVCVPPSGNTFPVGTTTVLVTATDATGNTSTCSFNVTIQPMSIQPTSISSSQGNTVCGTTVLTEVGGSLSGGGSYDWREGSFCGNGTTISTSSTCTTTSENGLHHYFVRIVGATCLNSILCASIPITSTIPQTWYRDADGDGYGNPTPSTNPQNPIMACTQPLGYVLDNTDCDDTRPLVHPGYVNAGPDQTKCSVFTATLAGNNPFTGTGTWSVVSGSAVFANNHLFNTTVSGLSIGQNVFRWTIANGTCGGSDDVIITVNPNPTPTIVGNPTFCFNGSDLLTTQSYLSYAWSANALNSTSQNVTVNTAGTYIVTVTDNNHCSATATKTITRNAPISTTITSPGVFCQGTQSTLGVSSTFSQYHWSNSQNNPTIIISTNGTYSVTVTTAEGCTGTASRTVTFLATPIGTIVAGSILNYCNSDSVSLYVTQNFSSYIWNNGDHARFTYITVPGTYTVTYTSSNGCTASTSITKTRLCEEATNFLTTGITKTTAVANWTPPSCSSNGYWLTLNQLTPSWSQVLNVFIQPNTHFTFSSLIPGTQYEWLLGTVCHIDLETHTFGADNRHNFTTLNARETGENGLLQSNFNIFPNPANNNVNVTFSTDKSEPFNVRMTDVTGRVVLDVNSISAEGDNQYELDLSSIAKGIYIVSLSKADGVLQTKLVVQ
ncbi:MAG: HYR domain-containing protein [Bacteroidota bacterium]